MIYKSHAIYRHFMLLLLTAILLNSCNRNFIRKDTPTLEYASVFQTPQIREKFEILERSVVRLNIYVSYQLAVFSPGSNVLPAQVSDESVLQNTMARVVRNESFNATAFLVSADNEYFYLLTCAHSVVFPDSLITYDSRANETGQRYVISYAEKTGQLLQLYMPSGVQEAEIMMFDKKTDLALLRCKRKTLIDFNYPALPDPKSAEGINRGDLLWISGFPAGKSMMIQGIAGKTDKDGVFITDAPLSEGYSGAPVFAYSNRLENFVLVGVGRSVAAKSEYVLKPEKGIHETAYNQVLPYQGQTYVSIENRPVAGVSYVIGAETISGFLRLCELPGYK